MNPTTTLTNHNPPATTRCDLNPNPIRREKSETPHNVSTHKTPAIQRWLLRHPRFKLHFTPTYSSWMNLVERWFSELTTKQLRRGTHTSVAALKRLHQRPGPTTGTPTPDRSHGARPQTRSSRPWPHIYNEFPTQDTSRCGLWTTPTTMK